MLPWEARVTPGTACPTTPPELFAPPPHHSTQVRYDSLTVALRLTGAFDQCDTLDADDEHGDVSEDAQLLQQCHEIFESTGNVADSDKPPKLAARHVFALCIARCLYNMALDVVDLGCSMSKGMA